MYFNRQSMLQRLTMNVHDWLELAIVKYKTRLVFLLALIIVFHQVLSYQQSQRLQQTLLLQPQKDDVWIINMGHLQTQRKYQAQYRVAQVLSVTDEYVELQQGSSTYRKIRGAERAISLDSLMLDSYFRNQTLTLKRHDLMSYFETQAIDAVYRPEDIYVLGGIVKRRAMLKAINSNMRTKVALNPYNNEGITLFQQGDYQAARESFLVAAEQGDSWGQYNLAGMLEHGQGAEINLQQAIYWLKQAAAQDHSKAKQQLETLCLAQQALCENSVN
ncbi:tetratricopeptide repeat protein [Pseudoalteromonas sp. S16_S37]|uniref:tetratricopeptide repeat protein n=1 Tax=Pseudoalteromonas sp. S16_S37 TaxID=2720228 RepID=UPI0016801C7A|nr:tetratricopeptide repeat protein [Pseudoalteromonas sp. S16_S37]MBD1582681.1 sel1 repeat family protein [Pseudoalteromonas sp. S16_S37]